MRPLVPWLAGALLVGSCASPRTFEITPRVVAVDAWADVEFTITGIPLEVVLDLSSTELVFRSDLELWIGDVRLAPLRVADGDLLARSSGPLALGAHEVRLHTAAGDWHARESVLVANDEDGGGLDAAGLDAGILGTGLDAGSTVECDALTPCAGGGTCVFGSCVDVEALCDPECTTTCASDCVQECQGAALCEPRCRNGASCAFVAGTAELSSSCRDGTSCVVDCRSATRCLVECQDRARCRVDCTGSPECRVSCRGSECDVDCDESSGRCGIDICDGDECRVSCEGATGECGVF